MGVASKVRSVRSIAKAARVCRASCGLSRPMVLAVSRSIAGGTWRGEPVRPSAVWTAAASWLKLRLSGPPISRVWPREPGSVTTWSIRAATSATETKLTGLSPRPNTSGRPDRAAVWRSRSTHSSMNALARTMVVGTPLRRRVLFGGVLHSVQFHRAVGGGAHDRHQHHAGARGFGGVGQVGVAVPVNRLRARRRPGRRNHGRRRRPPRRRPRRQPPPRRLARRRSRPRARSTRCAARRGSRVRTRTSRPRLVRRCAAKVPSRPVPPATRITTRPT